jgi:hypothetical protein
MDEDLSSIELLTKVTEQHGNLSANIIRMLNDLIAIQSQAQVNEAHLIQEMDVYKESL